MNNEYDVGATPEQFGKIIRVVNMINGRPDRLDFEDQTNPPPLCPRCHKPPRKYKEPTRGLPA